MARDNFRDAGTENPAKLNLQYKTKYEESIVSIKGVDKTVKVMDGGHYIYYDVATKEKGAIDLPLRFIILDESVVSFTGFNEPAKVGVYSNQVASKNALITMRQGGEVLCSFTLNDYAGNVGAGAKDATLSEKTKAMVKGANGKYTVNVFALVNIEDNWEIVCLTISGAPLTGGASVGANGKVAKEDENDGWFGFLKTIFKKRYSHWIEVNQTKDREKSSTNFTIPVYELGEPITQAEQNIADTAMAKLRPYLDSISGTKEVVPTVTNDTPAPYVAAMGNVKADDVLKDVAIPVMPEVFGGVKISDLPPDGFFADDDDLPF